MSRIGLVSDTHGLLRPEVVDGLRGVEAILHMGDVCGAEILAELEAIAPLRAVRGNCDFGAWADELPETTLVDAFGAQLYLVHNLGQLDIDATAAGVKMVLYGHSHIPRAEERDGVWYVNPGSCGPARFKLPISYAFLDPDLGVEFVTL